MHPTAAAMALVLIAILSDLPSTHSFASISQTTRSIHSIVSVENTATPQIGIRQRQRRSTVKLYPEEDSTTDLNPTFTDSESLLLGVAGIFACIIMIYSESVLFQTGCGLPAGPLGLVGAAEGISYLGAVGLVGYSLYTKIRTVSDYFESCLYFSSLCEFLIA